MRWLLLVCVACGTPAAIPPAPKPVPKPAQRDPMAAASLVEDLNWLAAPARRGRGSTSEDARAAARWIAGELRAAGYAPELQPIGLANQHNVIASVGKGRAIFVVAHYDHLGMVGETMYPGADDNASGVAVALAVARQLMRTPIATRVVFLFTGAEELGLIGSRAYVKQPTIPLAEIRTVLNLDMVGRNLFASTSNEEATLAVVGLPEDPELLEHALAAAVDAELTLVPVRAAMMTLVGQDHRGDDWVFRDLGVSAVHFSSSINDDYHQPTDTADKVSPAQLVRTAKLILSLVRRLAPVAGA